MTAMRPMKCLVFGTVQLASLASSVLASANTEPPPAYDARSVGMGSTGVAHVHNGAALFHNPAALQGLENGAVTLGFAPLAPQMSVPLAGPETQVKSERSVFPMFLVGGAYRVSKQFTLGLAVFPTMGFGAKYTNQPTLGGVTLSSKLAGIEIAPGAAFAITDWLAVGATYRVTYMSYGVEQPDVSTGTLIPTKLNLSGWGFLGVQLGAFAKATKTTRLGLTYRNKVPVNMTGNTEMAGQAYHTEAEFASPHTFKLGIAQSLLDDKLLFALDFKLALYREANKELNVKTDVPAAGTQSTVIPLDWKNSLGVYAGAEYRFDPRGLAVRLGYSLAQSATPNNRAQPILPPPGLQHAVHGGAGMSFANIDVDLGGYYMFGGRHIQPDGLPPGDYGMNAILVALSGNYRW